MCRSLFQQYSTTVPQTLTEAQTSDSELCIFLWKSFWFSKSRRTLTFRLDKQLLRKTCHLLRNSCFWLTQSRQVTRGYKAWGKRRRGHRRGDILTHQVTRVLGGHSHPPPPSVARTDRNKWALRTRSGPTGAVQRWTFRQRFPMTAGME